MPVTVANMVQIHPSVIMSISEHHTRTHAIKQRNEIVIGALLGKRIEHNVEVVDSFELAYTGQYLFDKEYYDKKYELLKQVNLELDLIGWYATTNSEGDDSFVDVAMHRQISEFIPQAIYIKMDPYKRENDPKISGSLPVQVFQAQNDNDPMMKLDEVPWSVVTDEIEIIGLEHNAKMIDPDSITPSAAIDNLRLQYSAIKQLKDRIKVISKFVKDVQSGALPYHEKTLADITKLIHRFPLMNSDLYKKAYNVQCNDVALNTYLGVLIKGTMERVHIAGPHHISKLRGFNVTHARR